MKDNKSARSFLMGIFATLAVGSYFLFASKNAKKNRQKIDWWMEDIKDEIYDKLEKIKDLTEENFDDVVDSIMEKYALFKDLKNDKVSKIKREVRKKWEEAQREIDDNDDGDFE